jgi:hypothetical protein
MKQVAFALSSGHRPSIARDRADAPQPASPPVKPLRSEPQEEKMKRLFLTGICIALIACETAR